MKSITSLTEANRYLEDVEVRVWEIEERVAIYNEPAPRIRVPYPTLIPARSITEALTRVTALAIRKNTAVKFMKSLSSADMEKEKEYWRNKNEAYRKFNDVVQAYNPPHQ